MNDERIREAQQVWLREAARDQRRRATPTEERLWAVLRARRVGGRRFRRQHPIGPYIADFLCFEARLVIEVDGAIHEDQHEYDDERDDYLAQRGYRVIRIPANLVRGNLPETLSMIETACQAPPLPRAGEGVGG